MTLTEITLALGIEKYPPQLEEIYKKPLPVSICDEKNILSLDKEYGLLGEYKEPLSECLKLVRENDALRIYGDVVASFMTLTDRDGIAGVKLPHFDEDNVLRFYPLLILLAALPYGIKEYRRRGFSPDEIYSTLHPSFTARISLAERINKKQGLDSAAFGWLRLYAMANVFPAGCFNITPKYYSDYAIFLKNVNTGMVVALATQGVFHKSGAPLGAAGLTSADVSFEVIFTEDDEAFFGHPATESYISPEPKRFSKSEWQVFLRSGDAICGLHIPRGANLSDKSVEESLALSMKIMRERYPEFDAKAIYCFSWMIDPEIKELLGDESKLSKFGSRFVRFPKKCDGSSVFTFVFPGKPESFESLPEDTTLQRKLKALYIDGGFIRLFGGVIPNEY